MKVMIAIHDFSVGGSERIALRLGTRWAAEGHDVVVFCPDPTGPQKRLLGPSCRIVTGPAPRVRRAFVRNGIELARVVRRERPDILFLPGNSYLGFAAFVRMLAAAARPPIVWKISNLLGRRDRGRVRQAVFDLGLGVRCRFVDRFVFMSESLRRADGHRVSKAPSRCHVVRQPVLDGPPPPARPDERGGPAVTPRIVSAGRFAAQKNFALLLTAFAALRRDRDAELHLLGDGPLRRDLEAQARELGLSDDIRFHGFMEDVRGFFASCDLFALSSNYEGFPSALVEALSVGIPAVATRSSPAIWDIVRPSMGAVVEPNDAQAFTEAMARVLDAAPPPRLAVEEITERYALAASAKAYLDLFRHVANREDAGPTRSYTKP